MEKDDILKKAKKNASLDEGEEHYASLSVKVGYGIFGILFPIFLLGTEFVDGSIAVAFLLFSIALGFYAPRCYYKAKFKQDNLYYFLSIVSLVLVVLFVGLYFYTITR